MYSINLEHITLQKCSVCQRHFGRISLLRVGGLVGAACHSALFFVVQRLLFMQNYCLQLFAPDIKNPCSFKKIGLHTVLRDILVCHLT